MNKINPFETIYYSDNNLHFISDHYLRLKRTCFIFKLPFHMTLEEFKNNLLKNINRPFGGLRITLKANGQAIIEEKEIRYNKELYRKGFYLNIAKTRRDKREILSYFKIDRPHIYKFEHEVSIIKGYDSCIIINNENRICETAYANIYFRKGKEIFTPKISNGLLNGVIRKNLSKYLSHQGYKLIFCNIDIEQIKDFEECFITNSIAGVFPVSKIENKNFYDRECSELLNRLDIFQRSWN